MRREITIQAMPLVAPILFETKSSTIFFPSKHTKESYRAQQRRAKQRRKQR